MYLILIVTLFSKMNQSVNKQQGDQIKSSIRQTKQNYQIMNQSFDLGKLDLVWRLSQ